VLIQIQMLIRCDPGVVLNYVRAAMASEAPSNHIAHTLLSRAHSPTRATTIFTDKVLHKPLTLRPTSPDPNSLDTRAHRRLLRLRKKQHLRRRQKPKPLSAKEKRVLGIYDIPKEEQKYAIYEPLHRMWVGYMWEILGLKEGEQSHVRAEAVGPILASADYHGAELEVVRSRCVGRVGCKGIVVKDTKFTFEVITKGDILRSQWPMYMTLYTNARC
jgi:ribonuclease P protein subunit POP4